MCVEQECRPEELKQMGHSVHLDDRPVQRACKKGVKKGNSVVTNPGETPHEALRPLIKPSELSFRSIPRLNTSPRTLHRTHHQLPSCELPLLREEV